MKKIVIKTAAALLMFVLPALSASGGSVTYTATYNSSPVIGYATIGDQTYTTVSYQGLYNSSIPGTPSLPVDYICFSVPWNATGFTVVATSGNTQTVAIGHPVVPCQSFDSGITSPDVGAYTIGSHYPGQSAQYLNEDMVAGENHIVMVAVMPVTYMRGSCGDSLLIAGTVSITLSYSLTDSPSLFPFVRRGNSLLRNGYDQARSWVVNPDDVVSNSFSKLSSTPQRGLPEHQLLEIENPATYLIISTDDMRNSMRRLAALKRQKGLNVKLVTLYEALNDPLASDGDYHYTYNNDEVDSVLVYSDDAGKLRQYIRAHYLLFGTKYVLLAGTAVPTRGSSDQYLSNLTAYWYGGHYGAGDVYVGRLLGAGPVLSDNYTDKLFRYELNPGHGDPSYLGRALCHTGSGVDLSFDGMSGVNSIFNDVTYLNPDIDDNEILGCDLLDSISDNHYGLFKTFSEGFPTGIQVCGENGYLPSHYLWAIDTVKVAPNVTDSESNNGLNRMNNKYYPMVHIASLGKTMPYSAVNGYDADTYYGESFTMGKDYGGPAFLGLTQDLTSLDQISYASVFTRDFFDRLQSRTQPAEVMQSVKKWMRGQGINYNYIVDDILLSYNYLGDPALDMWTAAPQFYNGVMVSRTDNGVTVSGIGDGDKTIAYHSNDGTTGLLESSSSSVSLSGISPNSTIMVYNHNHIPYIAPLVLQNIDLSSSQYVIASDVLAGRSVDNGRTNGNVTVKNGANYEIEAAGEVTLAGGFTVEKGAGFAVRSACF